MASITWLRQRPARSRRAADQSPGELLSLGAPPIVAGFAHGSRGVTLSMSRMNPERPDSRHCDRLPADVLLREEPDEEEDEEEDQGDSKEDDDDDDTTDDGYSE
jgi:hypothetical protein